MLKVFVSYSRLSESKAKSLVSDIESLGHDAYFDQELSGGQVWWDQILAMVRNCDVFVFLLDSKSLNSTACKREFGFAADLGKPILPILVSEGVSTNLLPPELSKIQFVDYRSEDRNAVFGLAKALASMPPSKPLPYPLPPPPEVPLSYLGNLSQKVDTESILDFQDQSTLVLELRRSLRDVEAAADTRTLLERMRSRRDILVSIAEEIDDLLTTPNESSSDPTVSHVPETIANVETPRQTDTRPFPSSTDTKTLSERLRRVPVVAVVIVVIGFIFVRVAYDIAFDYGWFGLNGIPTPVESKSSKLQSKVEQWEREFDVVHRIETGARGVEADPTRALQKYLVLAGSKNAAAQYRLGQMYSRGSYETAYQAKKNGLDLADDEFEAIRWFRKAANQRYFPAVIWLALTEMESGNLSSSSAEAVMEIASEGSPQGRIMAIFVNLFQEGAITSNFSPGEIIMQENPIRDFATLRAALESRNWDTKEWWGENGELDFLDRCDVLTWAMGIEGDLYCKYESSDLSECKSDRENEIVVACGKDVCNFPPEYKPFEQSIVLKQECPDEF